MGKAIDEVMEGYKETEIGVLPEDWEVVRLGEIAQVHYGKAKPRTSGTVPVIGSGGVYAWTDQSLVNFPTLIIGRKGTAGQVWLAEQACWPSDTTFFLEWKKQADTMYLYGYFVLNPLSGEHAKTTLPSLQRSELENYLIPLPPLPEQRKIAHVLSTIQRAIELQDRVIAAARGLKKSLMRHLFTYGPVPVDQIDRVSLKETEIGPVPEHWELVRLSDVAQIRYGLGQPPAIDDIGIPMIRATNIKRGRIIRDGLIRVRSDAIPTSRNPFLKAGDIIVVRSGAYTGDVAMVTPEWEGSIAGYDLVVSPKEKIFSMFCTQYLLGEKAQTYFKGQRDRSAQPHLNSHQLGTTLIPLPPLFEQHQIARILQTIDQKIEVEENRKVALQILFRTMLHLLMTGKVRVKDLEVNLDAPGR